VRSVQYGCIHEKSTLQITSWKINYLIWNYWTHSSQTTSSNVLSRREKLENGEWMLTLTFMAFYKRLESLWEQRAKIKVLSSLLFAKVQAGDQCSLQAYVDEGYATALLVKNRRMLQTSCWVISHCMPPSSWSDLKQSRRGKVTKSSA